MRGIWDMGQSDKIDYRRFYEAGFFGFASAMSKKVLMVKEQLFSTTKQGYFYSIEKGKLMIVD
jgi:hypothetical protein